jgi:intracellular septation protein
MMKLLFDFFPILLFFIAFKLYDDPKQGIIIATEVAILATFVQVFLYWLKTRRFEKMHLITLALIIIFGGATILLEDELYIKWKPTVVNWLFGVAFLFSQYFTSKSLARRMMEKALTLPDNLWARLNLSWVLFFFIVGAINLYVAYNFETETWVNFKLFGLMGLTFLFVIVQALFLGRYVQDHEESTKDNN